MKTREFWKVCKKLANEERLDVLRKVMASPDRHGLPVGQISEAVRLGQPATSTYLAQLQADCGLVACERDGRYCLYRAEPDRSDARAAELFSALRKFFISEAAGWAPVNGTRPIAPPFMYVLPALANATRVRLLGLLRERKRAAVAKLVEETGMTRINVQRHLACMERCGLAALDGDEVTWRDPTDSLSRLFIKLSLA